jgi:hypothetical protein
MHTILHDDYHQKHEQRTQLACQCVFVSQSVSERESPFLTLSSCLLLLSILLVLVSVLCCVVCGGQILFPVNCGGRRRFFPFFFSRTLTHAAHIFFPSFIGNKEKKKSNKKLLYSSSEHTLISDFSHPHLCSALSPIVLVRFQVEHQFYERDKTARIKSTYTQAVKSN